MMDSDDLKDDLELLDPDVNRIVAESTAEPRSSVTRPAEEFARPLLALSRKRDG